MVVPYFGRRRSLPLFCPRTASILERVGYSCRLVFIGSNSESEALRVLGRLSRGSPRIVCLSFSEGFKGRTTVCTNFYGTNNSCMTMVSTSLRSPPSLLPRVLRGLRSKRCSDITAEHIDHSKRPPVQDFFTQGFCRLVGGVSSTSVISNTESFHLVGHDVISTVISVDRCGHFSGKVFN